MSRRGSREPREYQPTPLTPELEARQREIFLETAPTLRDPAYAQHLYQRDPSGLSIKQFLGRLAGSSPWLFRERDEPQPQPAQQQAKPQHVARYEAAFEAYKRGSSKTEASRKKAIKEMSPLRYREFVARAGFRLS